MCPPAPCVVSRYTSRALVADDLPARVERAVPVLTTTPTCDTAGALLAAGGGPKSPLMARAGPARVRREQIWRARGCRKRRFSLTKRVRSPRPGSDFCIFSPPLVGLVFLARANYFYFRLRSSKAHGLGTFATLQGGHYAASRKRSKYFLLWRTARSPAGEGGGCKRRCDCADLTPCRHLLLPYGVLRTGSLGGMSILVPDGLCPSAVIEISNTTAFPPRARLPGCA